MSGDVDSLMERCPLKQEIRARLWLRYLRKVDMKRYLTLYSPPLMDVKWLASKGLISVSPDGVYKGTVGVAFKDKAATAALKQLDGRLELLLQGDINDLLDKAGEERGDKKTLSKLFPFEAINLDYCDSIFSVGVKDALSPHIKGIESLFRRQNDAGCGEFVLLLTTRCEKELYKPDFLEDLDDRINGNLNSVPAFGEAFEGTFTSRDTKVLAKSRFVDFLTVGITKFLTKALESNGYRPKSYDASVLIRDSGETPHALLHIALHAVRIKAGRPKTLKDIGAASKVEAGLIDFVREYEIPDYSEKRDQEALEAKYGALLRDLSSKTFEVPVPRPLQE